MKAHHWTLLLLLLLCAVPIGAQQRCVTVTPAKQTQQVGYVAPTTLIPAQGPTYSVEQDYLKQIVELLVKMEQRLASIEAKIGSQAGQPQNGEVTLGKVVGKYCFDCHGTATADKIGGGFQMVNEKGELNLFSVNEQNKILKRVNDGSMPKKKETEQTAPKLTPEEKKVFEELKK